MELTSFGESHDLIPSDDYIPPELIDLREPITAEQFEELCSQHRKLRLELTSTGELIVMPPVGTETGRRNADLTYQLGAWALTDRTGICFASCAGFTLPNGAIRSPDASWIKRDKWDLLSNEEKEGFAPFCPEFVAELRSHTDSLTQLRSKMEEYIGNGALLGWLIDPLEFRVYVYRPNYDPIILENPATVSGEPLLPGFTLNLSELW